jgi:2,6-dihydroxypyridine 3-monooxygenase
MSSTNPRAAVIGGSLGGLTAALLLRDAGYEVDVYERTPSELDARGGGIVLQPETLRWFKERSERRPDEISTTSQYLRMLGSDNSVVFEEPNVWRFTSWSAIYRALLGDFGRDRYHLDHSFVGIEQRLDGATVRFVNGVSVDVDLAIFADGINSTGRRRLSRDAALTYSGYVGWRGTVHESLLSSETMGLLGDALGWHYGDHTHICMYPIPGPDGGIEVGERLMNYVWYRNVPDLVELDEMMTDKQGFRGEVSIHPGKVQDRFVNEMRAAAEVLPSAARELVQTTAEPYIQPILDFRTERMVFGRAVILGDAAFVARPHAAAGTAKAADDAWSLADSLIAHQGDIDAGLRAWEPGRLILGNRLIDRIERMGRASQVDSNWDPTDSTLRFGLDDGVLQPAY